MAKESIIKKSTNKLKETNFDTEKVFKIVGIGIAGYLGIKVIKGLFAVGNGIQNTLTGDHIQNNIDAGASMQVNTSALSITEQTAVNYASQLLESFNWKSGFPWNVHGTDEDIVEEIFDKINSEDFKLIYKKFGLQYYNGSGSAPDNFAGGIQTATGIAYELDLVGWLIAEIGSFWDSTLYNKVKTIVEGAGFVFA